MSSSIKYDVAVINITMHPHSPEGYISLFKDAFTAKSPAREKYRGDSFMSLVLTSAPHPLQSKTALYGYVYRYTRIGENPWYDAEIGLPLEAGEAPTIDTRRLFPNLELFNFVLESEGHRLFVVVRHNKQMLSQAYFAKGLNKLLNRDFLIKKYGDVSVTVETDVETLAAIKRIDKLEKLQIRVTVPNDDDLSSKKEYFISRLKKQKAQKIDETLSAASGETLTPDAETEAHMELALSNGYIIASGKENGIRTVKKSSEYPVVLSGSYGDDRERSILGYLMNLVKEHVPTFRARQKNE